MIASALIGRRVVALPIPWDTLIRAGIASAAMAGVVLLVPDFGGIIELAAKATVGGLIYAIVALALDAGGIRGTAIRLAREMQ